MVYLIVSNTQCENFSSIGRAAEHVYMWLDRGCIVSYDVVYKHWEFMNIECGEIKPTLFS